MNFALNKPIGMNETGFDGASDTPYRIQAWDFLLAGGALYNNLDYSFTSGHEDGTFEYPGTQPGGGSVRLRQQLKTLREFMDALPFTKMKADENLLKADLPAEVSARALSDEKTVWAMYLHGGKILAGYSPGYAVFTKKRSDTLHYDLPAGDYELQWWHPRENTRDTAQSFHHAGGSARCKRPNIRKIWPQSSANADRAN